MDSRVAWLNCYHSLARNVWPVLVIMQPGYATMEIYKNVPATIEGFMGVYHGGFNDPKGRFGQNQHWQPVSMGQTDSMEFSAGNHLFLEDTISVFTVYKQRLGYNLYKIERYQTSTMALWLIIQSPEETVFLLPWNLRIVVGTEGANRKPNLAQVNCAETHGNSI